MIWTSRLALIARGVSMAVLTLAAPVAFAQTMYQVVPLLGSLVDPSAIDSKGKILGYTNNLYGDYNVCDQDTCHTLPQKGYGPPHWIDLNDQSMAVGTGSKNARGWVLRKGPHHSGGAKFLTPGIARAMAPDGAVVGRTEDYHAFLYTDHRIKLEGLTGRYPDPSDINSSHVIVGSSRAADNRDHATLWLDGGLPQDLGVAPGHTESRAMAINDAGVAVGNSTDPTHGDQPASFADGAVQLFPLPSGYDHGWAQAINAAGTIVGRMHTASHDSAGFIVEGNQTVDLNLRVSAADAELYFISDATAINDRGQIAAVAIYWQTNRSRAVRLDPIE
jgi:uncharacterized membrane protein